ncbi:hypothetical protein B0H67DRAFT_484257 [Lasiosphaeris hirsuta]|uniref:DUF8021 domain-containing protein n=1 Tax=Lasiosphaeris hirsuta TaxID=260670 RepID=A0AA40AS14_9PEZI|nr:hypothetical protein B0H67DRAFT_484257 [Lasiosphaeris hirsuta]
MLAPLAALLALTALSLAAPSPPYPRLPRQGAAASCTRALLRANSEIYLAAQTAGNPGLLTALAAPNFTYTEDAVARDIKKGALATALVLAHNRTIIDTTQCATYTEIISTGAQTQRVIGTQLRYDATGKWLVKAETLVTKEGDWAFNATQTYGYAAREDGLWDEIASAAQDRRAVIQAAGDAYLDLFNNASVVVPWGTPCHRLEGGWYTGNGSATDSCNVGVPSGVPITNRRYVVDEVLGTVDAFVTFGSRPDSHEFRVEGGKIRFVHTLTVMRNVTG